MIGDADVEEVAAIFAAVVERHAVPPPELPEIDELAWADEDDDGYVDRDAVGT